MSAAVVLVMALLGQAPTQERLDRIRADLFSRAEHLDDDVRELKQILASEPKSADAHALLGIAYRASGSPDLIGESVAEFREALNLDSSLVAVRFYLARVYLDLGRAARAKDELETALAKAPDNPEFLALLGETERQLKNPARAVEVLRQALQANDSNPQARYYLGLSLYDLGQRNEAIVELERVVGSSPAVADPYLALGTAYLDTGRVADARRTLEDGARINAKLPELHIQLARAYRLSGALQKADAQLTLAAPNGAAPWAASDYQRQQVEFDFYLERGLLKLQQGQLAAAADALQKVLQVDPTNEAATRGLADVRRRQAAARKKKTGGPQ